MVSSFLIFITLSKHTCEMARIVGWVSKTGVWWWGAEQFSQVWLWWTKQHGIIFRIMLSYKLGSLRFQSGPGSTEGEPIYCPFHLCGDALDSFAHAKVCKFIKTVWNDKLLSWMTRKRFLNISWDWLLCWMIQEMEVASVVINANESIQ